MYIGKRYDGFAYAFNTLIREAGCMKNLDPDCFSQRLIALSYDQNSANCFRPLMQWNDYMSRLLNNIGIFNNHILVEATENNIKKIPVGTIFLFGETKLPEWDITITQKMCNVHNGFLVCKNQGDAVCISNPLGYISMICSFKELASLIVPNESFVFYFTGKVSISPVTEYKLLHEASTLVSKYNLIQTIKESPPKIDNVKKKIAFQYGLIQYVQSRMRISEFFSLDANVKQTLSLIRLEYDEENISLISNSEEAFVESIYLALRKGGNK